MRKSWLLGLVLSALVSVPMAAAQDGDEVQALLDIGDLSGAEALLTAQADETGEVALKALSARVQMAMAEGKWDVAASFQTAFETALTVYEPADGSRSAWHVIEAYQQARLARETGDIDAAKTAIRTAIYRYERRAKIASSWEGALHYEASFAFDDENRYARRYADDAIKAYKREGMLLEMGYASLRLGDLEWARDKQRRAFNEYDAALYVFRNADAPKRSIVEAQIHIAERLIENGENRAAAARIDLAKEMLVAAGEPEDLVKRIDALTVE